MTREIPRFLSEMLDAPPRAGQGVHDWLFKVARQLHAHLPAGEIVALLENRLTGCGRSVTRKEITDAVANSVRVAWQPGTSQGSRASVTSSKWPEPDTGKIESIVTTSGRGLADMWEMSNPRIEDGEAHTEQIVDLLFPGNPLLCCGKSDHDFDTRLRSEWRGELAGLQLIVPSPSTARRGLTQEGKQSAHALSITGPRQYLVVECDFSIYARDGKTETVYAPIIRRLAKEGFQIADMCAAILLHLATKGPMVLALHSGGKSLHGWFTAEGVPEEKLLRFFRYAVSIGADPVTWSRSQFVRMPDGARDNGKRQTIYFQNAGIIQKAPHE